MQITFDLSEELVSRLNSIEDQLPQVIELGLILIPFWIGYLKNQVMSNE